MQTLRIPLVLDSRRRLAVSSTSPDVVRAQILDLMVTARGERVFRPTYGAGVPEMLFSTLDPAIFGAKEGDIKRYLQGSLTGGTITSVTLFEPEDKRGTLVVTVQFQLLPGGPLFSVAQTFTGLVTEESF